MKESMYVDPNLIKAFDVVEWAERSALQGGNACRIRRFAHAAIRGSSDTVNLRTKRRIQRRLDELMARASPRS
jgi:hypothetical protein